MKKTLPDDSNVEEVHPMTDIQTALFALQDPAYRDFHAKLIPTVPKSRIIGVRTPVLRKFAKSLPAEQALPFLEALPHDYYEENNLHAFLLEPIRDFAKALARTEAFLPYIDNWTTCDCFSPKAFAKAPDALLPHIARDLASGKTYTVRFGIGMLMRYFLDERFVPDYPAQVVSCASDEYYVNMRIAWYFATALAKQESTLLPWFTERRLPPWIHKKAIQKSIESFRIRPEVKALLRTLR